MCTTPADADLLVRGGLACLKVTFAVGGTLIVVPPLFPTGAKWDPTSLWLPKNGIRAMRELAASPEVGPLTVTHASGLVIADVRFRLASPLAGALIVAGFALVDGAMLDRAVHAAVTRIALASPSSRNQCGGETSCRGYDCVLMVTFSMTLCSKKTYISEHGVYHRIRIEKSRLI